jgi:endonuclease/exonuclease/phosphatase family metal-dependent hydrolase
MKIEKDTAVTLRYKVTDANRQLIENGTDPMVYLHGGYGNTFAKIESALEGQSLPTWRHTYHSLPRLVIDYILVRDRAGVVRSARVRRVDEDPSDRGPNVFGSDHHPLLARIDLLP